MNYDFKSKIYISNIQFVFTFVVIWLLTTHPIHSQGHTEAGGMSSGQQFMTNLLVTSLMADGGLEFAMEAAIKKESDSLEERKVEFGGDLILGVVNLRKMYLHNMSSQFGLCSLPIRDDTFCLNLI